MPSKKYYIENKEQINKKNREYYQLHKNELREYARNNARKNKKKRVAYSREYRKNNAEKVRAYAKKYSIEKKDFLVGARRKSREKCLEKRKEECRKYKLKNASMFAVYESNRRARIKNSYGKITYSEWEMLKNKYGNKCLRCGKKDVKLTIDHVLPIKLGGKNCIENIQPLCGRCNSIKSSKYIDYREGVL